MKRTRGFSPIGLNRVAARWIGCALLCAACVLLIAGSSAAFLDPLLTDGLEEHKSNNYSKAVELYTAALKKNPRSAEAFNWRGMAYEELGEQEKALSDYEDALRIEPKYADVFNNRGEVYRKQNKMKFAIADYKKAIELDGKFAEPHFNLAIIAEQQGKKAEAIKEFRKYLELAPKAPDKEAITKQIETLEKGPAATAKPATRPAGPPRPGAAPQQQLAQKGDETKPGLRPQARPGAPKPGEHKPAVQAPGRPGATAPPAGRPGAPRAGSPYGGKGFAAQKKSPNLWWLPDGIAKNLPPEVLMGLSQARVKGPADDPIGSAISLVWYLIFSVFLFLIARKLGVKLPWLAFIPIVRRLIMVKSAGKPILWFILLIVLPILMVAIPVGLIFAGLPGGIIVPAVIAAVLLLIYLAIDFLVCMGLARERGKSVLWGILLFIPCTEPIGMGYLALSK